MRGRLVTCTVLLLLFALTTSVLAGDAGGFLKVGPGGKVAGSGGVSVATIEDATASYWNPAALGNLKSTEVVTIIGELHQGALDSTGISVAAPTKFGVIGVTWARLGARGIPCTEEDPDGYIVPTGEFFDVTESVAAVSFGRALTDKVSVGVAYKNIEYDFLVNVGRGNGLDVGLKFAVNDRLSIGMVGRHMAASVKWDSGQETEISPSFHLGAAAKTFKDRLTLAADIDVTSSDKQDISWGAEYAIGNNLSVRFSQEPEARIQGVGFASGNCEFSYDWIDRKGLGYVGYFTTRYKF